MCFFAVCICQIHKGCICQIHKMCVCQIHKVCICHFKFGDLFFCSVYLSNTQSVNLSLQVWRFQSCCNLTFLLLVFVNSRIAHICHPCFKQHFTLLFPINTNPISLLMLTLFLRKSFHGEL